MRVIICCGVMAAYISYPVIDQEQSIKYVLNFNDQSIWFVEKLRAYGIRERIMLFEFEEI